MYIHVKVKTQSREEKIEKIDNDHYIISVRQEAKRNLANKRIIEILRLYFNRNNIKIINGHHSFSKLISIDD